ncbi:MAG: Oxidoreductase [uncultured Sulfurovum sp.]|uniref:Oxidoreductase n=1 Tax=uncultured Sulfurovum sp. TaxID=269237 RepID=A0A6S6TUB2_9BACT|nr:MAG: Oxidoreductase [uncultured Sulfurovum sp.]
MNYRYIGKSGLRVSEIGLGTMTFGTNANKKESFKIMDKAYERGINLIDTAELYPSPVSKELAGLSEVYIGEWLQTKPRDSIILASKVAGGANSWFIPPIRHGLTALDSFHIIKAVEASLKRLNTEYLDLYQIHWSDTTVPIEETLKALDILVKSGKVRYIGTSNDTAYGLTKANEIAKHKKLSRFQSIQNNFSLNNPRFLDEFSTLCQEEQISLLAYSPLAGGVLSGKYNDGNYPSNARYSHHISSKALREREMAKRFINPKTIEATKSYMNLAKDLGVSSVTLAIAWTLNFDFVASTLTSARAEEQLDEVLQATEFKMTDDILKEIEKIQKDILYPMG